MKIIADFHIHSKYSRATSRNMDIPTLSQWAKLKGINLLGTGDFTFHLWLEELKKYLTPLEDKGLFLYEGVYFILSTEVSNIFSQNNKVYRVHNVIMVPSFKMAEEVNKMLSFYGNLASDGRPVLSMSCKRLAQELFNISEDIMLIPAHCWTPWFGIFGSNSGFNSLEEAFEEYTHKLTALETGLSSDPPMNWRVSKLDRFSLVSNSDSHSPSRIGREANVFDAQLNYWEIKKILETKDKSKFLYTVEFFPEEGKYHYDGHRNCGVRLSPQETKKLKGICPKCGRPLTKGVLHRVEELADRTPQEVPQDVIPFKNMVPLDEIIAQIKGINKASKSIDREYKDIIYKFGSEFEVLFVASEEDLISNLSPRLAQAILNVRKGKVKREPGFDGEYGKIIIDEGGEDSFKKEKQLSLF